MQKHCLAVNIRAVARCIRQELWWMIHAFQPSWLPYSHPQFHLQSQPTFYYTVHKQRCVQPSWSVIFPCLGLFDVVYIGGRGRRANHEGSANGMPQNMHPSEKCITLLHTSVAQLHTMCNVCATGVKWIIIVIFWGDRCCVLFSLFECPICRCGDITCATKNIVVCKCTVVLLDGVFVVSCSVVLLYFASMRVACDICAHGRSVEMITVLLCNYPPPLVLPRPLSFPRRGWGTVTWGTPKGPSHRPRMLSKVFLWKVVSMFKNSRSNGAGQRNSTPSESRSKFHYIGSPLSARMIFILLHYLPLFFTVTSFAHQCFLCCVISSSAAIFVPHTARVRRYYGPQRGGGGPSLGDGLPWGGGGPSSLGCGRTQEGGGGGHLCGLWYGFGLCLLTHKRSCNRHMCNTVCFLPLVHHQHHTTHQPTKHH